MARQRRDESDHDTKTVVPSLPADHGESQSGRKPVLFQRCRSSTSEVFIRWHAYLGSGDAEVRIRIGKEAPRKESWPLSTDGTDTFFPGNNTAFMKALAMKTSFSAWATPEDESPISAVFDTTGLFEALKPLAEACNWKM
jgi:type VI secretion system protein VasI